MWSRWWVEGLSLALVFGQVVAGSVEVWPWVGGMTLGVGGVVAAVGRGSWRWIGVLLFVASFGGLQVIARDSRDLGAAHLATLELPRRGTLTARAVSPVERRSGRTIVVAEAESFDDGRATRPVEGRVRVAIRNGAPAVAPGDRLTLVTTLRRPRGFASPGVSDWGRRLRRRGVHVTASVWDARDLVVHPGGSSWRRTVASWRDRVHARIDAVAPARGAPVLHALVVGDESGITPAMRSAFTDTGLVHVLSVSGLHVGLVALGTQRLLRAVTSRSAVLVRWSTGRMVTHVAPIVPVGVYVLLAGAAVPAVRSGVMAVVGILASSAGRHVAPSRALAVAAGVIAGAEPGAPLEIGYQLSVVSVAALIAASAGAQGGSLRRAVRLSWWAWLATVPLCAWYFQRVSLVSPLTNPVLVPLFGAVVLVPGLVGAALVPLITWPGDVLLGLAGALVVPGIAVVEWVGGWSVSAIGVPMPNVPELLAAYVALVALAATEGRRRRCVAVVVACGAVLDVGWWLHDRFGRTATRVTFLDVGQGDAAVVELPGGHVTVIDAGGLPGGTIDPGAVVVVPFLRSRKIGHVDVLALSHGHPDHIGGAAAVVEAMPVDEVWWSGPAPDGAAWEALAAAIEHRGVSLRRVVGGDTPAPGFTVIHPPTWWSDDDRNDASMVLRLEAPDLTVVFGGDVERRGETIAAAQPLRPATIVKVPHHGSRTSSTPSFVDALRPRIAVVSVGADNRYGQPAPEVIARWQERGALVLRTDTCGTLTIAAVPDTACLAIAASRPECPGSGRQCD